MSELTQYFAQNQFCVLVEYLTSIKGRFPVKTEFAGFPACMTLADRVHTDEDIAPLRALASYPAQPEKVLHFSGKGRDIKDFERFLDQAELAGQYNLLLVTGDKLKQHQYGDAVNPRSRYLESVNAVMAAKQRHGFAVGVALNPFKYTEAEKDAQYFKLEKKIKAGADFIITQLGFDLSALKQAKAFLAEHQYPQKILACVMPLTLPRAQFMLKQQVAGIVITAHMLAILTQEHSNNKHNQRDNSYRRCALQILMCKHLGFAGVHLSACHKPEEQAKLAQYIEQYQSMDLGACEALWNELWQLKSETAFYPEIIDAATNASQYQVIKHQHLQLMHKLLFNAKLARGVGAFVFRAPIWSQSFTNKLLLKLEYISKHAIVGCETCGQCRLAETLYVCPETCPKGLANGPCGGTTLDRCEFGDRECIHSVKARLAKAVKQTDILQTVLIPTVPIEIRGSSSWKNWYLATQTD